MVVEVGGVEGEGKRVVEVEMVEENERKSTVMWLIAI